MGLKENMAPTASWLLPSGLRDRLYGESWLKDHVDVSMRDHDEALAIRTHPLSYLELHFKVANRLPVPIQVYGASVEIWLGKPVIQFYTFLSDQLRSNETRETLRAVTFLNPTQMELLAPPKKESAPPNVSIVISVCFRSAFGTAERTVKMTWKSPKVCP